MDDSTMMKRERIYIACPCYLLQGIHVPKTQYRTVVTYVYVCVCVFCY